MSFASAALRIIQLCNKVYPLPSNADPRARCLYKNTKYSRPIYIAVRLVGVCLSAVYCVGYGYRLCLIFIQWKRDKTFDIADAVICFIRMISQGLNTFLAQVLNNCDTNMRFAANQSLRRAPPRIETRHSQIKSKLFAYSSAVCFLLVSVKAYLEPFGARQRHIFGDNLPLKLLVSLSLGFFLFIFWVCYFRTVVDQSCMNWLNQATQNTCRLL